jgi:hypothetical protein
MCTCYMLGNCMCCVTRIARRSCTGTRSVQLPSLSLTDHSTACPDGNGIGQHCTVHMLLGCFQYLHTWLGDHCVKLQHLCVQFAVCGHHSMCPHMFGILPACCRYVWDMTVSEVGHSAVQRWSSCSTCRPPLSFFLFFSVLSMLQVFGLCNQLSMSLQRESAVHWRWVAAV